MDIQDIPSPKQVAHYSVALARHILHGSPLCTQEEIDARHAICMTCPNRIPKPKLKQEALCGLCRCYINTGTEWNMLLWADSQCPDKPPRWLALAGTPTAEEMEELRELGSTSGTSETPHR